MIEAPAAPNIAQEGETTDWPVTFDQFDELPFGAVVTDCDQDLGTSLPSDLKGALILSRMPGSIAATSGFLPFDCIVRLDSIEISSAKGFQQESRARSGQRVCIKFYRRNQLLERCVILGQFRGSSN